MSVPNDWIEVLTQKQIKTAVKKLAFILDEKYKNQDIVLVCILKGAVYFFTDLSREMKTEHSEYHLECSSYKSGQKQGELEILSVIQKDKFKGKKVILVDELFDNGKTMFEVKREISKRAEIDMNSIFTVALMKKNKAVDYDIDLFGVVVPNSWLVGYGLDHDQKMRNLKSVWAVPKKSDDMLTADDLIVFGKGSEKKDIFGNLVLNAMDNTSRKMMRELEPTPFFTCSEYRDFFNVDGTVRQSFDKILNEFMKKSSRTSEIFILGNWIKSLGGDHIIVCDCFKYH
jgi:hypoxanthine phosphoribosyltransferase